MPRVTRAYQDRQMAAIMDAAEDVFAARGFSVATMGELIEAAGVSSSTVYRYFPDGKQSLVRQVLARRVRQLSDAVADAMTGEATGLDAALGRLLWAMAAGSGYPDARSFDRGARLAVHGWGERMIDPDLADLMKLALRDFEQLLIPLVAAWQEHGEVRGDLPAGRLAALLIQCGFGIVAQQAMAGSVDVQTASGTLAALLAPS